MCSLDKDSLVLSETCIYTIYCSMIKSGISIGSDCLKHKYVTHIQYYVQSVELHAPFNGKNECVKETRNTQDLSVMVSTKNFLSNCTIYKFGDYIQKKKNPKCSIWYLGLFADSNLGALMAL